MSSSNKRPIYLLVALLAVAAVITVVLLQGLGSGPEPGPPGGTEAGTVAEQENLVSRASSTVRTPRRADARPTVAAPGTNVRKPSVGRTPQRRPIPVTARLPGQAAPTAPTRDMPAVSAALQAARPAVDRCYEQGRKRNPGLAGTATLRFTVVVSGGRGQIQDSALRSSDFKDPAVENCLLGAFRGQRFDAPGPDGRRTLNFPILLGPVGKRPLSE
jgi:hypothetical protein